MLQKKFWSVSNRFSVKLVQSVGGILGIADYRSSLDENVDSGDESSAIVWPKHPFKDFVKAKP